MERRPLFQVQPCVLCKGETTQEMIELTYEYPRFTILVKGVSAAVCAECGEQFVPGDFGVWLGDEVAKLATEIEQYLSQREAVRGMQISMDVDEQQLVDSGRIRRFALA